MSDELKRTKSARNSRVTLITTSTPPRDLVKPEPTSPLNAITDIEASIPTPTLRRSARSTPNAKNGESSAAGLDVSSYSYTPVTPSPRKRAKIELVDVKPDIRTPIKSEKKPSIGTPKSSAKKLPQLALEKPHKAPDRWEEQYRLIARMREGINAPVDTMGCERPRTIVDANPTTLRFHILISLMLSSQTKDPITSAAVTNLHLALPGGLTAQSLADASIETVHECINKVGFWRRKTEYIQEAAKALLQRPGQDKGDVPKTLEGLCELKGVGPKMAFLALQCAWDINAGIGVDVHVHRITNRLRWHKPQTTTAEQTRLNLQSWLPSNLHKSINPLLVGFGQVICLPVGPRCDHCLLATAKICPSRVANIKSEGRKEVVYTFTHDDEELRNGAKLEVKYEEGTPLREVKNEEDVKEEVLEEPGLGEEAVLEVLDQVDGVKEIGACVGEVFAQNCDSLECVGCFGVSRGDET